MNNIIEKLKSIYKQLFDILNIPMIKKRDLNENCDIPSYCEIVAIFEAAGRKHDMQLTNKPEYSEYYSLCKKLAEASCKCNH